MKDLRRSISHWVFEEFRVSERSLAISRILFACSLFVFHFPRYQWMASFPSVFYMPPLGLGMFFREQPPGIVMWLILAAAVTLNINLLLGWKTRVSGLCLAAVLFIGNSFEYSFGKINHDILALVILAVMSFSGWERQYSVDGRCQRITGKAAAWPLSFLAMCIGFAMFSAALPKAMTGWFDPALAATKGHIIYNAFATERDTWLSKQALAYTPFWVWKINDWLTLAIESAFLLSIFSRRAFRMVCALSIFFHAGIHFMMNILFVDNIIAYSMFMSWDRVAGVSIVDKTLSRLASPKPGALAWLVPVLGVGLTVVYTNIGNPLIALFGLFGDGDWIVCSLFTIIACVVASTYLISLIVRRPIQEESLAGSSAPSILLFDGVCGLCNRFVDFLLRHDRRHVIRFVSLQSTVGQAVLRRCGLPTEYIDSMVFVVGDRAFQRSSAVLESLRRLGAPWSFFYAFLVIPPAIRNIVYDFVAANRYKWFGRLDTCRLPTPDEQAMFIDIERRSDV